MVFGFKLNFATFASIVALFGFSAFAMVPPAAAQDVPSYEFDPTWPKPLPNNWIIQSVTGMFVDSDDNIWVLNSPRSITDVESYAETDPPLAECCARPPAILKFDQEGNLLSSWGGPGHAPGWPRNEHTIFTDSEGNVWIAGSQAGDTLMKFTSDGQLISDFGKRGPRFDGPATQQQQDNQQTDLLLRGVAAATLDEEAREIFVADGYLNKRILVFDLDTGAFKRGWGAYGMPLDEIGNDLTPPHDPSGPPLREYRPAVHCVQIANDGLVYVCDRGGNRVQVFNKQGEFQKEFIIANDTLMRGSVASVSFSPDPEQRFIFVGDIMNSAVWILNRQTGEIVGRFGRRGYNGGQFMLLHIAVSDSQGNIYTGEVAASGRIQKFIPVTQ